MTVSANSEITIGYSESYITRHQSVFFMLWPNIHKFSGFFLLLWVTESCHALRQQPRVPKPRAFLIKSMWTRSIE